MLYVYSNYKYKLKITQKLWKKEMQSLSHLSVSILNMLIDEYEGKGGTKQNGQNHFDRK